MKRTLLFILAFLPMLASADAIEIDGIYYNLDREAKTAEVTSRPNQYESDVDIPSSSNQYKGDVDIPESVTNDVVVYSVTSIGDGAFRSCSGLTSITIPSSVTSIGELAFSGCSGLTSVTIPNSVTSIGWAAFDGCSGLTSITFGNGVISIGDFAFSGCTSLTSITIPSSVTSIGTHPFFDCSGLQSIVVEKGNTVYDSREDCNAIIKTSDNELISGCTNSTIPNSVTKIGQSAFKNCKGLRSVRIPNSVVSVGQFAFQGCSGMTSITIPNSVTSIGSYAFRWCSGLTSITIPYSVTSIDEFVFYECSGLTSVTIPNSVTSIGRYAFDGCSGLTNVICYAKNVPTTPNDAFINSGIEKATLHVPATSVSAYQATRPWKNFKEIVALSENDTDDSNYLPFVEVGKEWHMVVSRIGQYRFMEYTLSNETLTEDATGKTYFRMYSKDGDAVHDMGLFREEDRKVYYLEPNSTKEILLFDYSLKVGDTYETYTYDEYDEKKKVTYKVLSVNDYTEGPKARLEVYDKESGNMITQSRYLRMWTVCSTDNGIYKTWIEGVGSLEGPLANLYEEKPISTCSNLAYVSVNVESEGFIVQFLPFSFYDMYNQVHGSGLSAAADQSSTDWDEQFTFELEGNLLHVHGKTYLNCGCNHYAYFFEEQTEDPFVRKLHFQIQREGVEATCYSFAILDFYVPGFYPEINYTVVDEYGEEYPVFNKMAYRPMIEDGKVWKVGSAIGISDDIVKMVDYYYFDGDTIINGKTCKQMMFQRYVSPDYLDYDQSKQPSLDYVGAWYEEDKKVYLYYKGQQSMRMMYDFSLDANTSLLINNDLYLVGPRQTEGLEGFKGIYRDVMFCANEDQNTHITFWLEGVGGIMGPGVNAFNPILVDPQPQFLMSCTVGDEVIYLNDKYEDGATPTDAEAKKHRFDFTHTIKTKPKTRGEEEEQSLYGEYNNLLLGINLNPLDDTYLVRITNESDQIVYEKTINAGSIVGLNIDISAFAKGRYTVTIENSGESFTGEFETITTGIQELINKEETKNFNSSTLQFFNSIYNLQGQRLNRLQKGLNIVNGRKVFVK